MARNFGALYFWHMVPGAPQQGTPAERAKVLLEVWRKRDFAQLKPGSARNKGQDIFRALALELAIADGGRSAEVAELIATACPKWTYALIDPVHVYSGDGAGPGTRRGISWRRLETLSRAFDVESMSLTGKTMSLADLADRLRHEAITDANLAKGLAHVWGDGRSIPAIEKSIQEWRVKPAYKSDVAAAKIQWEDSQET